MTPLTRASLGRFFSPPHLLVLRLPQALGRRFLLLSHRLDQQLPGHPQLDEVFLQASQPLSFLRRRCRGRLSTSQIQRSNNDKDTVVELGVRDYPPRHSVSERKK